MNPSELSDAERVELQQWRERLLLRVRELERRLLELQQAQARMQEQARWLRARVRVMERELERQS